MNTISLKSLLEKLNKPAQSCFEGAVGVCVTRGHYEVTMTHVWHQVLNTRGTELDSIFKHYQVDLTLMKSAISRNMKDFKTGNTGKPVFSPLLIKVLKGAWMEASLNLNQQKISTGSLLIAQKKFSPSGDSLLEDTLSLIPTEDLSRNFSNIIRKSHEGIHEQKAGGKDSEKNTYLERFTVNFTELADQAKIDPIFGRDHEIHQIVDILARRRKNNPIMVGEAGVGKTAVIEGLALRISQGDVPDELAGVQIHSLDLGLLSAGAGVRGEFENRLKGVIKEVKESNDSVILFIDEAHTLIGAGGEAGQNDAANLLKPEMARGELKVLAATTFTEFRKYFEKDPAMARRFQVVNISEPDPQSAAVMLRGLKKKYEEYHSVRISHDAIVVACELSHKYIAGRQLPDKAVDLLDTATARVKMGLNSKPLVLIECEQQSLNLKKEIDALLDDRMLKPGEENSSLLDCQQKLKANLEKLSTLKFRWKTEQRLVNEIHTLQQELAATTVEPDREAVSKKIQTKWSELDHSRQGNPLVNTHVTPETVAGIISEWTGIPAGNMMKDEAASLLSLEPALNNRVKGQSWGISELAGSLRNSKAGLKNPNSPMGVFILAGPSGVGKTEAANAVADVMFGGCESVVTINMSEYQDSMSVSQLKGASAGYVGYGDGGVLTEGVRKNPYSVVILDEVEKAHKDVLNMFYQVFDKGVLKDGEGREINFKNTVIIMTSNLGLETIIDMAMGKEEYSYQQYKNAIFPELTAHFSPALLGRCKVLPFLPLGSDTLTEIVQMKLNNLGTRLMKKHKIAFAASPLVIQKIVAMCTSHQSGARNLDSIIDEYVLPDISRKLLLNLVRGEDYSHLYLGWDGKNNFEVHFSTGDFLNPLAKKSELDNSAQAEPVKER